MRKQWRCYFCDDVFTRAVDAAEHFGGDQGALAACQIKGHEHKLLQKIREQEAMILSFLHETEPLTRAMEGMRTEHAEALRRTEEDGYNKGVRDMREMVEARTDLETSE